MAQGEGSRGLVGLLILVLGIAVPLADDLAASLNLTGFGAIMLQILPGLLIYLVVRNLI